MRAVVVRRCGPPEVLQTKQVPDPKPKPGEVLVRVKAIGINFADLLQRMGLYPGTPKPPFVPGLEIAGVVEKVAEGVRQTDSEGLSPGDTVAAIRHFDAYAEWVVVPAKDVYRLPPGMKFEDGAAILVNYATAYHSMFTMGNLQPGDRILIHGAAGGCGNRGGAARASERASHFRHRGPNEARISTQNRRRSRIDYEKSDFVEVVRTFAPDGIEMAMDPIGGKNLARSQQCLGPTGRLVVYGLSDAVAASGKRSLVSGLRALLQTPRFHPLKLMSQNLAVIGIGMGALGSRGALLRGEIGEILRMYSEGQIKPVIAKTFPLDEAAAAHQYIHDRNNIGKVVLAVG